MEMGERKQKILAAVVELYIRTGEPVGSKALLSFLPMSVSSATVRNEMSDLHEMGYLEQPHTSAGRVPSQKGYRYYVDHLMPHREIDEALREQVKMALAVSGDPEKLVQKAGELLARFTNCTAIATTPIDEAAVVKRIELVPISNRTAMVVMMTSTGIIKTGVCRTETSLTNEMADMFRQITAKVFVGQPVSEIGTVMIQTIVASLGEYALSMSPIFVVLADLARDAVQAQIKLEGEQNLLHHRELSGNAFELLQFFDESEKLNRAISANKGALQVMIGNENMYRQLENSSMIIARYNIQGHDGGAIGIIGPTRMDYARIIPGIEYLTRLLGEVLTDSLEN